MSDTNGASAPTAAYAPKVLAKKFRIDIADAIKILDQYGSDRKAVDKAARRIAA